ncbi:hypothetical protein [Gallaecimonas mangrovi]|uniref:hypothetical protein n=1 Tax=Gallaecimonas mangrovi TaxID=2291597 RepID=UPI000E204384|nr:hypothetical protein [Gallaecimonas mangrovi]
MSQPLNLQIEALARALVSSAKAGEWHALARHDRLAGELVKKLQPVPAHLSEAFHVLKSSHQEAMDLVDAEQQRLEQLLAGHRERQEGLRAYQQLEENP